MLCISDELNVSTFGNRDRSNPKIVSIDKENKATETTHQILPGVPSLPQFQAHEVSLEKILGQGEFGEVFSIGAIQTTGENEGTSTSTELGGTDCKETQTGDNGFRNDRSVATYSIHMHLDSDNGVLKKPTIRQCPPMPKSRNHLFLEPSAVSKEYMSTNVLRDGQPRYAVKRLRKDLKYDVLEQAMADLANEAHLLMSLHHPNICKMRGTIGEAGKKGFAILLDRLTMTLREKMMEWKEGQQSGSVMAKMKYLLSKQERRSIQKGIYEEKLMAIYDVARALRHLAVNRIIFRDLKPENVGVDVRGDLRIFDFGLAKELNESDMTAPDMYSLTGMTGSRRYMAPEVVLCKDYGLPADVYSFAIMAWEVMSDRRAYSSYSTLQKHFEMVVQREKRPDLKKVVSSTNVLPQGSQIRALINCGWSHEARDRPSIDKVCEVLFAEVMMSEIDESSRVAVDRSSRLAFSSLKSRAGAPLWG